jgi:hypothetical protein
MGKFTITRRLGAGAMGVVYAAYDTELERKVAIKFLLSADDKRRARLRREAKAMARLRHPNVAQVYEVGEFEENTYIAMEFVQGQTLTVWSAERPRTLRERLQVMIGAGRGLHAAHRVGLVHRDFKPDNLMIDERGQARVLDFGIVWEAGDGAAVAERANVSGVEATATGALLGTPAYMSPEQAIGHAIGAGSDQFSFGVVLYELLAGHRPHRTEGLHALLVDIATGTREPLPKDAAPPWLAKIVDRTLQKEPPDRYDSIEDVFDALEEGVAARIRKARVPVDLPFLGSFAVISAVTLALSIFVPLALLEAIWDPTAPLDEGREAAKGLLGVFLVIVLVLSSGGLYTVFIWRAGPRYMTRQGARSTLAISVPPRQAVKTIRENARRMRYRPDHHDPGRGHIILVEPIAGFLIAIFMTARGDRTDVEVYARPIIRFTGLGMSTGRARVAAGALREMFSDAVVESAPVTLD